MRYAATICGALVLATFSFTVNAGADEVDRLTNLTFSGPVQLPGVTLPAGTYTFKLADPRGDRHIVQVLNKANSQLITTLMTIPNHRLEAPKDPYVMFAERPAGSPQAMKAWFYPGNALGEEFVYPREQALAIARANGEPVLTTQSESADASAAKSARVDRINDQGTGTSPAVTLRRAGPTDRSRAPASTAAAGGGSSQETASARLSRPAAGGQTRSQLPQTASPLALAGILGGLALLGSLGLQQLRKHRRPA